MTTENLDRCQEAKRELDLASGHAESARLLLQQAGEATWPIGDVVNAVDRAQAAIDEAMAN